MEINEIVLFTLVIIGSLSAVFAVFALIADSFDLWRQGRARKRRRTAYPWRNYDAAIKHDATRTEALHCMQRVLTNARNAESPEKYRYHLTALKMQIDASMSASQFVQKRESRIKAEKSSNVTAI